MRAAIARLDFASLSLASAWVIVSLAVAAGEPEAPGTKAAVDRIVDALRAVGRPSVKDASRSLRDVVVAAGIAPAEVAALLTGQGDVSSRTRDLVTNGAPELDFAAISLLAHSVDPLDDEALIKLFTFAWRLRNDDHRRQAAVFCLEACARNPAPEAYVDAVIARISAPGHGPFFRASVAEGIVAALGDVSFAFPVMARIVDTVTRVIIGDAMHRAGDVEAGTALIEQALATAGADQDSAELLREAIDRISRYPDRALWLERLLVCIARIDSRPLRAEVTRVLVDSYALTWTSVS